VHDQGVRAQDGAEVEGRRWIVERIGEGCGERTWGWGLRLLAGASVAAEGVRVEGVVGMGVGLERSSRLELEEAVVADTRPCADGAVGGGTGAYASRASTLVTRRVRVSGAFGAGIYLWLGLAELSDTLVTGVRGAPDRRIASSGVLATPGTLDARRLLVTDVDEVGIGGLAAELTLTDTLVTDVHATDRGFGMGIAVSAGASAELSRVGVRGTSGGGILALTGSNIGVATAGNAWVRGRDVAVLGVSSQSVLYDPDDPEAPPGRSVAYGLHAGTGCGVDLERASVHEGGFGLFAAGGARSLSLATSQVSRHLDAAGATAGTPEGVVVLEDVGFTDNAVDAIVDNPGLPEGATLPPPTAVCENPPCDD